MWRDLRRGQPDNQEQYLGKKPFRSEAAARLRSGYSAWTKRWRTGRAAVWAPHGQEAETRDRQWHSTLNVGWGQRGRRKNGGVFLDILFTSNRQEDGVEVG